MWQKKGNKKKRKGWYIYTTIWRKLKRSQVLKAELFLLGGALLFFLNLGNENYTNSVDFSQNLKAKE